jgi:hypothetical protein
MLHRVILAVAFSSKKLSDAQRKYDIYEKEAMPQIYHLKLWRCYLQGAPKTAGTTLGGLEVFFEL